MKSLVLYHADCTDGFGAAYAAWTVLGDKAEYVPVRYGDNGFANFVDGCDVYILDFSFPREVMNRMFASAARVVWLDHHKTAFEMWCPKHEHEVFTQSEVMVGSKPVSCNIILDNNRSGALISWDYFHPTIKTPEFISMIDDRDRWQFKVDGSKEFHAGLAATKPWEFDEWDGMTYDTAVVRSMVSKGSVLIESQSRHVESMAKQDMRCKIICPGDIGQANAVVFEGLAVNATLHISEVGHELANKSGSYGLVWYLGQDGKVKCSLRSNGDYDVSSLAKLYGGGGHKNAAGFETNLKTIMLWIGGVV